MSYDSKTIKEIIENIEHNEAYLPAIQRKFVWTKCKIEQLFDSLMRGYPIGSFLFWELRKEKANEYVFYNFLKNYDQREPYNKRKTGEFLRDIIGVLDGQQRLSSLYLGVQGTYKEKLKYSRKSNANAYPETKLYLNLLDLPYSIKENSIELSKDEDFNFKFLTEEQSKDFNNVWFKIGEVISWDSDPDIDDIYDSIVEKYEIHEKQEIVREIQSNKRKIKKALRDLHKRITEDQIINYFKVTNEDLDDILKIFVRVNSGGTILSKTDLLFSTIIATWEDGREEIENFLQELNNIGDGFNFDNDFLMRVCLVLSDLPVLFKVNSFKSENVSLIKNNWEQIKESLVKTVHLLHEFGFSSSNLTSHNSIIIIAYYFMKNGKNDITSQNSIKKYLLHSLLKNIYGGQGDQVITSFRNTLRIENKNHEYILKNESFNFDDIINTKLPTNKSLKINEENIDEFLEYKKGNNSFFVLSMLYPHLQYKNVKFHQDHIHPDSRFTNAKLKLVEIPNEKWEAWKAIKDTLPNLQLLEGSINESKNAKTFKDWLYGENNDGIANVTDVNKFLVDNYIPKDISYDFKNFEEFYLKRKEMLKEKLMAILNVKENSQCNN